MKVNGYVECGREKRGRAEEKEEGRGKRGKRKERERGGRTTLDGRDKEATVKQRKEMGMIREEIPETGERSRERLREREGR